MKTDNLRKGMAKFRTESIKSKPIVDFEISPKELILVSVATKRHNYETPLTIMTNGVSFKDNILTVNLSHGKIKREYHFAAPTVSKQPEGNILIEGLEACEGSTRIKIEYNQSMHDFLVNN